MVPPGMSLSVPPPSSGWLAFIYLLVGALLGSAWEFVGGRAMSRGALERISGARLKQLSRQLAKRGIIAASAGLGLISHVLFARCWLRSG
jgi:uncharacterized membrane protein YdjX (TVP38/TMEM64 family)